MVPFLSPCHHGYLSSPVLSRMPFSPLLSKLERQWQNCLQRARKSVTSNICPEGQLIFQTLLGMSVRIFALLTCILAFPQLFLSKHVCAAPKMLRTAPAFQSLHLAIDRMVLRIQIPSSILPQ